MQSARRGDFPRLRTRVEKDGMNYKGYNIAVHELGHNVEQVFSLYDVDHTLLAGVPNTAFTEALAFVFQAKDLELLGLAAPTAESRALKTLGDFWSAYEMCAVGLVDMGMWHWMYEHPDATPGELRDAVVALAKETWNRYYAPVFGQRDVVLLGVYAHMVDSFMYLPDYAIGRLIALQIEQKMAEGGRLGDEFERMAKLGRVTPDLWMKNATGQPVSADALLEATGAALATVQAQPRGRGGR
jgi:oligoendopeptidase F